MRTAPRVHVQFHHAARVRGDQLGQLRRGEFVRNHTRPFLAAPVRSRSLSSLFDVQIVYVRWRSGCLRCTACPCCAYLTQRTHSCILADCQGEAGRVRGGAARDLVGRHARRGAAAAAVRGRRAARRRHPRARRSVTSRCHCCLSFRVIRGPYVCQCGFWLSLYHLSSLLRVSCLLVCSLRRPQLASTWARGTSSWRVWRSVTAGFRARRRSRRPRACSRRAWRWRRWSRCG